jgi:hypothetical protein
MSFVPQILVVSTARRRGNEQVGGMDEYVDTFLRLRKGTAKHQNIRTAEVSG